MGTNFYAAIPANHPAFDADGADDHVFHYADGDEYGTHIGKSSGGWCFALHCTDRLKDLADWEPLLRQFPIHNEYGETISFNDMMETITERSWARPNDWSREQLRTNYAVRGPNNLVRSVHGTTRAGSKDGVKWLEGKINYSGEDQDTTWDCVEGEFS